MDLATLTANWQPGSQDAHWTWADEYLDLWTRDAVAMSTLSADIAERGVVDPVVLGPDGRVWDGHHRVCVAMKLRLPDIPTTAQA